MSVITLSGRFDHSHTEDFRTFAFDVIDQMPGPGLVIDLSGLEYLSSGALRVFALCDRRLAALGGQMCLTGLSGIVLELFRLTQMDRLLCVGTSIDAAVADLSVDQPDGAPA